MSFLKDQFLKKGFNELYGLDRNSKGVEIMLCIREDISSKLLSIEKKTQTKLFMQKLTSEKSNACFAVLTIQIKAKFMPI